ncbi:CRASP family complement regulator-acquiring lipoprotein [Borreliella lanei]|uniref:Uncharacterized protein n=1 Tax=Borreliella lanei TaxID=373540 RepID=A0A7X0DKS5_9SPIR|nr:hypothetical protein [Borreliella lanei]MBB6208414.1 hypothetical protein [Borreliella lanei]
MAADTERAKRYRKNTYSILNAIDDNQLKKFSEIVMLSGQMQSIFNALEAPEYTLANLIIPLYSKKDNLEKLEISNLKKLKDSFEKLLSTTTTAVSKMLHQLLLDYQNDKNHIRTDNNKLKSRTDTLYNQIIEKRKNREAKK